MDGSKRPIEVAQITVDVVYKRLPPGVLKELRPRNPKNDNGRRDHKHHQFLTPKKGHPKLRDHLLIVVAMMKGASTLDSFHRSLARSRPFLNEQIPLPYEEE
ncbi:MAG: P63C domain-containing protein [Paracoccaceae bacterium]|nr:P63C domain-containing protein [Paracoccaceae bacterium]